MTFDTKNVLPWPWSSVWEISLKHNYNVYGDPWVRWEYGIAFISGRAFAMNDTFAWGDHILAQRVLDMMRFAVGMFLKYRNKGNSFFNLLKLVLEYVCVVLLTVVGLREPNQRKQIGQGSKTSYRIFHKRIYRNRRGNNGKDISQLDLKPGTGSRPELCRKTHRIRMLYKITNQLVEKVKTIKNETLHCRTGRGHKQKYNQIHYNTKRYVDTFFPAALPDRNTLSEATVDTATITWFKGLFMIIIYELYVHSLYKGCGMGPWLVLVSPCFRENVVATCKIGSFLCSLNNFLQKNVIVFFFWNQISKWRSFEKRATFDLLFTLFSPQGKVTKIPSAHISLTYIHVFCSPYWLFLSYQFWKKYEFIRYGFSLVWVQVLILIRAILEQSINNKMVSKL